MQVTLYPHSPAEKRLLAAFMNDLAELQEIERANDPTHPYPVQPEVSNANVAEGCEKFAEPETPAPAKKSRAKKTDAAQSAENTSASETSSEPAAAGDSGNDAATVSAEAGGSTETTTADPASPVHTHDELRKIFAALTQAGKGDLAIKELGKLGHTSIKGIPADKLDEAHAVMVAL